MKNMKFLLVFLIVMVMAALSCKKNNETKNSTYNSSKSHNMGQNCMNCHKAGGEGEGVFTAAGTVYDSTYTNPYANTTVKLYTGPNGSGSLKYTLQVDAKGNFYTTGTIDYTGGLYPAVSGNAATQYMGSSISSGACNNCHGSSTNKIWTK